MENEVKGTKTAGSRSLFPVEKGKIPFYCRRFGLAQQL